jgi:hypothetical protein
MLPLWNGSLGDYKLREFLRMRNCADGVIAGRHWNELKWCAQKNPGHGRGFFCGGRTKLHRGNEVGSHAAAVHLKQFCGAGSHLCV